MNDFLAAITTPEAQKAFIGLVTTFFTLVVAPRLTNWLSTDAQHKLSGVMNVVLEQALKFAVDQLVNKGADVKLTDVLKNVVSDPNVKSSVIDIATGYVKNAAPVSLAKLGVNDQQLTDMLSSRISAVIKSMLGDAQVMTAALGRS